MLFSLSIRSVALIKQLDLEFNQGLTVFTGETGAGKSIIIDSIALMCGARSDKSIIRTGEEFASVEGVFGDIASDLLSKLEESEIYPDEEGNIYLYRKITAEGKSVSRINGRTVPLSKLRETSSLLLDIHGQQDTARLSDESLHPKLLDMYASNEAEKEEYTKAYKKYTALKKELADTKKAQDESAEKKDWLAFRLKELKAAKIKEGETESLSEKRNMLINREKIVVSASEAYSALYANDVSALSLTAESISAVKALVKYVPKAEELALRLESVKYELEDIGESLTEYTDDPEGDPKASLDRIEARLSLLTSLCRKYRTDEAGLISLSEQTEKELALTENGEERIAELEKELEAAEKEALDKAQILYETRVKSAAEMENKIKEILASLDMPSVTFVTEFEKTPLSSEGCDTARFLISANAGEQPRAVSKIASGGECARIMLAVKSVLADSESIGTMIFDEVDTGISGATSARVGIQLKKLATADRQVICVTHSAQISALAHNHLLITKSVSDGRTETSVEKLSPEKRIKELARIMGGIDAGEEILKAAEAMLSQ